LDESRHRGAVGRDHRRAAGCGVDRGDVARGPSAEDVEGVAAKCRCINGVSYRPNKRGLGGGGVQLKKRIRAASNAEREEIAGRVKRRLSLIGEADKADIRGGGCTRIGGVQNAGWARSDPPDSSTRTEGGPHGGRA